MAELLPCTKCKRHLPREAFYPQRNKRGCMHRCKACDLAYTIARRDGAIATKSGSTQMRFVPEASPARMAELARELAHVTIRELTCRTCKRRFEARVLANGGGARPWCPPCIERRVAQVLAERERYEEIA